MDPAQIRLAEEVEQRRELWDATSPAYKMQYKRKNLIWDEVATALNISRDQAKQQWRNVKDYYRVVRIRLRSQSGGPEAVPLTPLQEQQKQYLSFLDDVMDAKAAWSSQQLWWPTEAPNEFAEETDGGTLDTVYKAEQAAEAAEAAEAGSADDADAPAPSERLAAGPLTWTVQTPPRRPAKRRCHEMPPEALVAVMRDQSVEKDAKSSTHAGFFKELDDLIERMGPRKAYEFKLKMYGEAIKLAFPEPEE